jgi:plastocyanin
MVRPKGALLRSPVLLGVVLFAFSAGFPPFDDIAEVDLSLHMAQHVLIILSGVLIAYPIFRRRAHPSGKWVPWGALLAASALVVFWHLPAEWDSAVLNPGVHALEHLCFLAVGLLIGSWVLLLSDSEKIGALLTAFFGHMFYAVLLISPWNVQVYPLYSLADQAVAGWVLLLTGPLLIVGVAYVVARNPRWLAGFSGGSARPAKRETPLDRLKVPRWVTPALTVALIGTALAYFGMTAVALSAGPSSQVAGGVHVLIAETPVSWQYSPQVIHVVIGVNSTVTWESRSISYDTVTSRTGVFGSGPIPPGGSFTFTFQTPGTYNYYCLYHPWMVGTVIVTQPG